MSKIINKSIIKSIGYGVFIASIILLIFSSLLSYQQEAGALVVGMLVLSLLFTRKSSDTDTKYSKIKNVLSSIVFFIVPLFFSFLIIKGDGRSWFLVLLVVLTCWLILFDKTNDEK
jgi:hypothetical protein